MFEITNMAPKDISLKVDLYEAAYDRGISFSQLLEQINPSDSKDELDAFERQLQRFGIQTQGDPKSGLGASKGEMFFQSNHPESRILFPEYLNRVARQAAIDETDIMSEIVAATETITDSTIYRAIYIEEAEANRKTFRVAERGGFPVVKISWSEKATSLAKYGVALNMSYEFVRRVSLPILNILVGRIMIQRRIDEVSEAISALGNGDGTAHSSGGKITSSNISAYQTAGTDEEGTMDMSYLGWLSWLYTFWPGMCTTVISNKSDVLAAFTIAAPNVFPIFMTNFVKDLGTLGGVPIIVNGRAGAQIRLVMHDDINANTLIGLDKKYALIAYREVGADLTETNKIINGQWNEIVISNTIGFQTLFAEARKELITVHDQAQQGSY